MTKLLVLADDLTGALDTGIQFAKIGIDTVVSISPEDLNIDTDVLVVDTESRHIPPEVAYERAKKVLSTKADYIYKKTDSTLRGNIGVEFKAIVDVISGPIIFVPAFPEMGRTTKNGIQYVNGVPIGESPFALDPINPVKKSYIPDIIKEQSDLNCIVVNKEQYEIAEFKKDIVYIIDGETRDDLERLGKILKEKQLLKVTAGCAGFAQTLARLLDLEKKDRHIKLNLKAKPLTLICGSINEVSLRQIEYLKRNYQALDIVLSPEDIIEKTLKLPEIRDQNIVAIRTVAKASDISKYKAYALSKNIDPKDLSIIIQETLGEITLKILQSIDSNTLIVFGGDTLLGIVKKLGIEYLYPLIEIENGIVLSKANSIYFITKAGGFGREDTIDRIIAFIKDQSEVK